MIRMTRLSDYASVLMMHFARDVAHAFTARDLSADSHLPLPTVSKILKALARGGVLVSHRGLNGGYNLAREPERISLADIISAIEGPISLTECGGPEPETCPHERLCPVQSNWKRINRLVHDALSGISLAQMTTPIETLAPLARYSIGSMPTLASRPV